MTKPVNPPKHSVVFNHPKYAAAYPGTNLWFVLDADGREVERCDSAAAADAARQRRDAILAREV